MAEGYDFSLETGDMVDGHYRVERPVGKGGMGAVYEVTDVFLNQRYALKTLLPPPQARPDLVARFQVEAQIGAHLAAQQGAEDEGRERILQVLHCGFMSDGRPYAVMPLIKGMTLQDYLTLQKGRLEFTEACELAYDLCVAVDYMHSRDIVHRDIKPANVLIVPMGARLRATVVDYGLAKRLGVEAPYRTAAGGLLGTPGWAPREQLGGATAAFSMDLFPLAKTIFLMLTGRSPWAEHAEHEVNLFVQERPPRAALYTEVIDKHDALETAIANHLARCLSHDPSKRDDAYTLRVFFDKTRKAAARRAAGQPPLQIDVTVQDGLTLVSTEIALRDADAEPLEILGVATQERLEGAPTEEGGRSAQRSWGPPRTPVPVDHRAPTRLPPTKPLPVVLGQGKESSAKTPNPISYPVKADSADPTPPPLDSFSAAPEGRKEAESPASRRRVPTLRLALGALAGLGLLVGAIVVVTSSPRATSGNRAPTAAAAAGPESPVTALGNESTAPSAPAVHAPAPPVPEPAAPRQVTNSPVSEAVPAASSSPAPIPSAPSATSSARPLRKEKAAIQARPQKAPTRVQEIESGYD